jgi:hypothetical protein
MPVEVMLAFNTESRPFLGPCQMGIGGYSHAGKTSAHLHLVPRSRMSGALPQNRLRTFMAW